MSACPTCGCSPCTNPNLCAAAAKADEKARFDQALGQTQADDWLATFAKKSQEALAAKAAEKQQAPAPNKDEVVDALARKGAVEYDQVRGAVSETLGIRSGTLDELVTARRETIAAASDDHNPAHWAVVPSADPVDGAALLDAIRALFRRHIVLPPWTDIALSLWVLHAWTHDTCEISPIMCLTSPAKRCGKTSVMILLTYLTPRSELASNLSTASIFRYIEAAHPTLLIDEGDSFLVDNEEMRGVLNSGHTKAAASVVRVVEERRGQVTRRFSTWAPKAIALIKRLPDTLADRSIIVRLDRKPRGVSVERLRKRDTVEFRRLRERAARWAADNSGQLVDPEPSIPDTLHDRAADNWRPMLAIADLVGGAWPELARKAAIELTGVEDDDGSLSVMLLTDIRKAFGDADEMRSIDLVAALVKDPERPWSEFAKGKPITQNRLAKLLGAFQIISETVHPPGLPHGKGYKRAHLERVWDAYCPTPAGQNAPPHTEPVFEACKVAKCDEMGTTSAFQSVQEDGSARFENADLFNNGAGAHACTLQKGGNGSGGHSDHESRANRTASTDPVCAHCGWPEPAPNQVAVDGLNIWLHPACERPYSARLDADGPGIPALLRRGRPS